MFFDKIKNKHLERILSKDIHDYRKYYIVDTHYCWNINGRLLRIEKGKVSKDSLKRYEAAEENKTIIKILSSDTTFLGYVNVYALRERSHGVRDGRILVGGTWFEADVLDEVADTLLTLGIDFARIDSVDYESDWENASAMRFSAGDGEICLYLLGTKKPMHDKNTYAYKTLCSKRSSRDGYNPKKADEYFALLDKEKEEYDRSKKVYAVDIELHSQILVYAANEVEAKALAEAWGEVSDFSDGSIIAQEASIADETDIEDEYEDIYSDDWRLSVKSFREKYGEINKK